METVVHNIRDLSGNERSAAEKLVGHALRENQQLVIQVLNIDVSDSKTEEATGQAQADEKVLYDDSDLTAEEMLAAAAAANRGPEGWDAPGDQ
jgi:hypothetical protein